MSSLRLLLVRHGQTESNVLGLLDTLPPGPPLNDVGRRQAEELADLLAAEPVVAVYASVAVRARETAAPIAARHGLDVRVAPGLQEVFVGDLECRGEPADITAFMTVHQAWHAGKLDMSMPNGESGQDVLDRFLPVVDRLRAEHPDGVVVLVSHGATLRFVGHWLAANVTGEFAEVHFIRNCGAIVLEADGDGWRCLDWAGDVPS